MRASVKWRWSTFCLVKAPTAEVKDGKQKKSSMRSKSVAGGTLEGVGGSASAMCSDGGRSQASGTGPCKCVLRLEHGESAMAQSEHAFSSFMFYNFRNISKQL